MPKDWVQYEIPDGLAVENVKLTDGQFSMTINTEDTDWADVILDSHANMEQYARPETVDCVVFNFGRLPGGDPKIFTLADSSVKAIEAGLRLLKSGGVMAIALYYGGENGYEEKRAIEQYLKTVDDRKYTVLTCDWSNRKGEPPLPILIWKER